MSTIFAKRERLRPYAYPEFAEFHKIVMQSPWTPFEVQMQHDVLNFQQTTPAIRGVIGGILRGFTQAELIVGDYWRTIVAQYFPQPEIVAMATAFSYQETVHAIGYDHLEASLGLDTFSAFSVDPSAQAKIANIRFALSNLSPSMSESELLPNLAMSLAIFSGGVEGISLYSAFAILLSFTKLGLFKGMAQILSWSVLDEELHSRAGIRLFHQLIAEYPFARPEPATIYSALITLAEHELNFIRSVFVDGDLSCISATDAMAFIRHRTNRKLAELGYEPVLIHNDAEQEAIARIADWFYPQTSGTIYNDFFSSQRNGGAYTAKLSQDFLAVNLADF